jgi:hypothetical protein
MIDEEGKEVKEVEESKDIEGLRENCQFAA